MTASGQKREELELSVSALLLTSKADIIADLPPQAAKRIAPNSTALFDRLVGAQQECRRYIEAKHLLRLQV